MQAGADGEAGQRGSGWAGVLGGVPCIEWSVPLARYGTGDLAGAGGLLRQVVVADPVDADAHALLGEVLAADGDTVGAAAERAIAGRLSPRYAAACDAWGRAL